MSSSLTTEADLRLENELGLKVTLKGSDTQFFLYKHYLESNENVNESV